MSFLDATGWTEAVLINLHLITGRKGDCMRYRSVGPGRRSEPPAPAVQRFAVRSCRLAVCHGTCQPAPPARQGPKAVEKRTAREEKNDGGRGAITEDVRAGAVAMEPGEWLHLSAINHKQCFPADSKEEPISFPARAPTHSFGAPGGIDFGDVPLPARLRRLRTRRAGDSLMWQVWRGRTGCSGARCPAAWCRAGACGAVPVPSPAWHTAGPSSGDCSAGTLEVSRLSG